MIKKIKINEIYNSILLNKFINSLHKSGKKENIELTIQKLIKTSKINKINFLLLFFYAIEILKPTVGVLTTVKHGKTYFIGTVLNFQEQYFLAIKWLVASLKFSRSIKLSLKILNEIISICFLFKSSALKTKKQNYYIVFKNRSLSHYRWR